MRKHVITLLFLGLTTICFGQGKVIVKGSKNVTSKTTKIDTFKRLVLNENFKITLEKGDTPKITVETDDNIHKFVEAKVAKDGTLDMFISAIIRSKQALNVTLTYVDGLEFIQVRDNAELTSSSELDFNTITLKTAGESKTTMSVKAKKFNFLNEDESEVSLNVVADTTNLELNSQKQMQALIKTKKMNITVLNTASADVGGDTDELNLKVENGAKFNGGSLNAKKVNLTSGTNSLTNITATDSLSIKTTGSSTITVSENPNISIKELIGTLTLKKM